MGKQILGIHHVTAIAGDPQRNVDFYTGVLGLRFVKLSVNFDDPGTYHFYYGDDEGRPGTLLTFFPWPGAPKGRAGVGQVTVTSFSIPPGAVGYWVERFRTRGVSFEAPLARFEEEVLAFHDPDGLALELVAHAGADAQPPRAGGPVPEAQAIRGLYGVALAEEGYERTASLLSEILGFRLVRESGSRFRYRAGQEPEGSVVDVLCLPNLAPGAVAVGAVHHVAWRTPSEEEQRSWRAQISALGYNITPVIDRRYFRSVYFREPGGVLFEIATDPPGFTVDETREELGTRLMLPPWLETRRPLIDRVLPPLRLPEAARGA